MGGKETVKLLRYDFAGIIYRLGTLGNAMLTLKLKDKKIV